MRCEGFPQRPLSGIRWALGDAGSAHCTAAGIPARPASPSRTLSTEPPPPPPRRRALPDDVMESRDDEGEREWAGGDSVADEVPVHEDDRDVRDETLAVDGAGEDER